MDREPAVGVDVGGTFTDVLLVVGDSLTTVKTPTTTDPSRGVLAGIELACDRAGIDPASVGRFRHATTTAVNAVLEGAGAETALVTTAGFRDVLAIRRQTRPALYDIGGRPPAPLVPRERRYELAERTTPDGVERTIDPAEVRSVAAEIDAAAVAVCLLHAYADPANERRVAAILREELDAPVSASHEVLAAFREYERTATTVVDAYVTPIVAAYLSRLASGVDKLGLPTPEIMQSNGGIADIDTVTQRAVETLVSGPAAGVIGAGAVARRSGNGHRREADLSGDSPDTGGVETVVSFDMGGTSTDVSLMADGAIAHTTEAEVAGHPVGIPMVEVTTVGSGGGSIAWVDEGGALRVGPTSAGADPGPACYDRGGTVPTATDAALVLGYLPDGETLGARGDVRLSRDLAQDSLRELAEAAMLPDEATAAAGVYRVATARMARAVRGVTTERGHDVRGLPLVAFGGAGPMFAAALAERLGMARVVVPRASGVLSAFGLLAAAERHDAVRTRRTTLETADGDAIEAVYGSLREDVLARTRDPDAASVTRAVTCRYVGQSHELEVPVDAPFDAAALREAFSAAHDRTHGYRMDDPIEVVTLRATATVPGRVPSPSHEGRSFATARTGERPARFGLADDAGTVHDTAVYAWDRLPTDATVSGPSVVEGGESTVVVPPGWAGTVDETGALVLRDRDGTATAGTSTGDSEDET